MKMYFHFGDEKYVLFQHWHAESPGAMLGACCAIFCLAVLYEGLKEFRTQLKLDPPGSTSESPVRPDSEFRSLLVDGADSRFISSISSCRHLVQTALHMLQAILSYCLMLVFMTFNLWLCLALVLGLGAGYFVFGWSRDTPEGNDAQQCQ
ncbi:hypothetical protein RRG08_021394 [Elysia crispata]|uniref:Copper transport protein n=1 Tax=Elysia crispata TaxID=231223 RepID=A0AAE0Z873_9GAST|nr:hypothetical protein RRG08_021394 [Elysia crispata]